MELLLDGNSEIVPHGWRKIGHFVGKILFVIDLDEADEMIENPPYNVRIYFWVNI